VLGFRAGDACGFRLRLRAGAAFAAGGAGSTSSAAGRSSVASAGRRALNSLTMPAQAARQGASRSAHAGGEDDDRGRHEQRQAARDGDDEQQAQR
jgi:hypothetical protein